MICIDSNLIIYASKGIIDPGIFQGHQFAYSSIVKIETLGYSKLTQREGAYLEVFFNQYQHCLPTEQIVNAAIQLKAKYDMDLGDAVVAATALENDCSLWTANIKDFEMVEGVSARNPLSAKEMERIAKL